MHLVHFVRKKQTGTVFPAFSLSFLFPLVTSIRDSQSDSGPLRFHFEFVARKKKGGKGAPISTTISFPIDVGKWVSGFKNINDELWNELNIVINWYPPIPWKISGWNIRREYKVTFNRRSIFDYIAIDVSPHFFSLFFLLFNGITGIVS